MMNYLRECTLTSIQKQLTVGSGLAASDMVKEQLFLKMEQGIVVSGNLV